MPEEILVPRLGPTNRLVSLPPHALVDAASGEPAKLRTVVRFGARGGFLLARFDARHRGIVATLTGTNAALWTEDVVELFLSSDEERRRYLELEVNPLGAKFSASVDSPTGTRRDMRVETFRLPRFSASVSVRADSWSALLRVPLEGLDGDRLCGNAFRIDRTTGEFSALCPTERTPPDFHVVAAFTPFRLASGTGLE